MTDEKDLEIARLRGRLEQAQATTASAQGGFNPVQFLAWLVVIALGGFVLVVVLGSMIPDPSPEKRALAMAQKCNSEISYAACVARESAEDARRYPRR